MEHVTQTEDFERGHGPDYLLKLDIGFDEKRSDRMLIEDLFKQRIEDNSVFDIECNHIIVHVANLKLFMEECWRILVPHGRMSILAPYYTSLNAMQDYRHTNKITENTFYAFSKKMCGEVGVKAEDLTIDFEVLHIRYFFLPEFAALADTVKEYQRRHYWNVVSEIEIDLKAVK